METFTFMKHVLSVEYPESSAKIKFGRGYEFASRPIGPDQVTLTLSFKAMFFAFNPNGSYNLTWEPTINMALLENFYKEHRLYEKFIYPHPVEGNLTVRFDRPLQYKIIENGNGQVEPFQIRLLTQP